MSMRGAYRLLWRACLARRAAPLLLAFTLALSFSVVSLAAEHARKASPAAAPSPSPIPTATPLPRATPITKLDTGDLGDPPANAPALTAWPSDAPPRQAAPAEPDLPELSAAEETSATEQLKSVNKLIGGLYPDPDRMPGRFIDGQPDGSASGEGTRRTTGTLHRRPAPLATSTSGTTVRLIVRRHGGPGRAAREARAALTPGVDPSLLSPPAATGPAAGVSASAAITTNSAAPASPIATVARPAPSPSPTARGDAEFKGSRKVHVNSENEAQLMEGLHLDARRARMIIEFRELYGPFQSADDLGQVNGISDDSALAWEQAGILVFD